MDYKYPESYSEEQTTKIFKDVDGVYRAKTYGDLVKADINKGLVTIAKEDTLSKKAFARKMRELTERTSHTTDVERRVYLGELFWRHLDVETKDGVTWLSQKPHEVLIKTGRGYGTELVDVQAQSIRLRDWWIRQLT